MEYPTNVLAMSIEEIIDISAEDTLFFGHYFFPRAIRQSSPVFHGEICEAIEDPRNEKVAVKVARGFAKTTLAKVILAKRVAYALTRTGLVVSETAEHSVETVKWLKHAVETQGDYARVFGLVRGDKAIDPETKERYTWRDDKIQIVAERMKDEQGKPLVITIVGTGIFGQSRGLNIEDYRPDFILLDDVIDEDNAKTPEQRRKVSERIYGAICNTLAPRTEAPNATILFLQTPLHRDDAIELARLDDEWTYLEYSCFDENGESRWPERFPTVELNKKKEGFRKRNMLDVWLREFEVSITDPALAYFVMDWFKNNSYSYMSDIPPITEMTIYVGCDPTPPPKELEEKSSSAQKDLDDAVTIVIGCHKGHVYVLQGVDCKSPLPRELWLHVSDFVMQYRPRTVGLETVLFARTTKYYFQEQMVAKKCFFHITPIEDKRRKSDRIRQEITDLAFEGKLHLPENNLPKLWDQLECYPDVSHDDWLDALAIALMCRNHQDIIEGEYSVVDDEMEELGDWRSF